VRDIGLALTRLGTAGGPRLVFLHGFTQTAASWRPIADRFTTEYDVVLIDLPGHGQSSAVAADLDGAARLVAAAAGPATYIGYSMGARVALHIAVAHPAVVYRLVLVGGTPGIEDDAERAQRRASDDALAGWLEEHGLDAFLQRWLANPMFASLPPEAAGLEERRGNTVEGLASSLRLAGTGTQAPLWDRLDALRMPVVLLAGANDTKFVEIGTRMHERIATSTFETVPAAGHAAHLEQPEWFATRLESFLRRTADGPSAQARNAQAPSAQAPSASPAANRTP
jgi:2-succinyl-6-hydroxy-2,4-cyclohexadiene-1-carboxylate synthase